ncbi:MAG: TRAP transporter substrate-binding protein [Hyphomicrobiales bacterium]|nr:TRAP transporter substrate-binding protein [Hyphomicrobiales bacterium]
MKFRESFKIVALSAAVAGALVASAYAQDAIVLKVSHFLPPNHTFHKAMVAWGEQLDKQSGGRLKLQIYPAGQLGGGPNRQFDAARNAITDIAISLHGATPGRYATTELASLPFASPSVGNTSKARSRRITELAPEFLAAEHEGLKILWMAVTPSLMFHSKQPITKLDDFKGLKIRYAGAQFKAIVDALGAVPLAVPPQETQDALSKGIVDAATFPYEGAASFDLGTVAKNTLEPGVASATFAVVMNPAKYESLPDDLKKLIDATTGPDAAGAFGEKWDQSEIEGKTSLMGKGVQVHKLSDDAVAQLKALLEPQIDAALKAVEDMGRPGRQFFENYTR